MRNAPRHSPMVDLSTQAKQTLRSQGYFYSMPNSDSVVYDALSHAKRPVSVILTKRYDVPYNYA